MAGKSRKPIEIGLNAAIVAVEGTLPVNITFLAEGEEIMGSPTYNAFVERYRDRFAGATRLGRGHLLLYPFVGHLQLAGVLSGQVPL